jgi:hypothetical protein
MTSMPEMLSAPEIGLAKPQITEPTKKTTMADWNIGRRP